MAELVANCPRCGAEQITFDVLGQILTHVEYDWKRWFEAFCHCRRCSLSTVFVLAQKNYSESNLFQNLAGLGYAINSIVSIEGYISEKDRAAEEPPEHLPIQIDSAFREGASCMAIGCNNAAATMFRLCIDLATKSMLREESCGLNSRIRRNLGLRLPWLFEQNILPAALQDLSTCIKDDGNDGAHEGDLGKEEAEDILDFTYVLLERLYTEPKRIELAQERRVARRRRPAPAAS
ncbi:DUF4145 domain-containing protein [Microbulbifer mangrovi]|uniref:DUF4145 domain-containing protein n=1 Tax=Microbulbifer mangrovi TaxID=927787 RepID=UPI00099086AF|nr:DUF4145 domain-containing protein [Microbulbifer mangrovi]